MISGGGVQSVYSEILNLTDCDGLQRKFDVAAANNDREEAGTPNHRITLGYMIAADDTLEARGCYD